MRNEEEADNIISTVIAIAITKYCLDNGSECPSAWRTGSGINENEDGGCKSLCKEKATTCPDGH